MPVRTSVSLVFWNCMRLRLGVCVGFLCNGSAVWSVVRILRCGKTATSGVFVSAQQFRMQFPLTVLLFYVSSHRCATCVLELHATLWRQPACGLWSSCSADHPGKICSRWAVACEKPGRVRRIAQRAPASCETLLLRGAQNQRPTRRAWGSRRQPADRNAGRRCR